MDPDGDRQDVILVVDDDEDIARFVEFNLRLHGFDVIHASDGQEALERDRAAAAGPGRGRPDDAADRRRSS